jgi:Raf kinase inhibitor-like YbhB/YbcL family protein
VNPPLEIEHVPEEAQSLVLIMNDPDVPKAIKPDGNFDHWVLYDIPPETTEIPAGTTVGTPGKNGAGKTEYAAPCPPKEYEPSEHRYFFKLYALDTMLNLPAGASRTDVEEAMRGHVIAETQLVGKYKRK